MDITLLVIGKTTSREIAALTESYVSRLRHYVPFRIVYIPDAKKGKAADEAKQKANEGEMILSVLQPSDHVCLLDEHGKEATSIEFSSMLQKRMASGLRRLVFVIGGPYGFSKAVYDRADSLLSLSRMTFNHEMVRLFFTEQACRAMTILKGEPYHHE